MPHAPKHAARQPTTLSKGVLRCLVHTSRDNNHLHVDITTPMCFGYEMKKGAMGRLSES